MSSFILWFVVSSHFGITMETQNFESSSACNTAGSELVSKFENKSRLFWVDYKCTKVL